MAGYVTDIEKATLENADYQRVLFTGRNMQLVLMTLRPGEDGKKTHNDQGSTRPTLCQRMARASGTATKADEAAQHRTTKRRRCMLESRLRARSSVG